MHLESHQNFAGQQPESVGVVHAMGIAGQEHGPHAGCEDLTTERDPRGGGFGNRQDVMGCSTECGQVLGTQFQTTDLRKSGRERDSSRQ